MISINRIKKTVVAIAIAGLTIFASTVALAERYTREFDERGYLQRNPDVAEGIRRGEFKSAYDHYVRFGQYENRAGAFKAFNEQEYLRLNPDVAEAVRRGEFASAYDHYVKFGQYENRSGAGTSPTFSGSNNNNNSPISNQDLICNNLPGDWLQEAFFQTPNRVINICRATYNNQLTWFERSVGDSIWNNYPTFAIGDRFVNSTNGYSVNDTQLQVRRGDLVILTEPVIDRRISRSIR